jgi:hypothetical protein
MDASSLPSRQRHDRCCGLAATVIGLLVSPVAADTSPAAPYVAYERGLSESLGPTYQLAIAVDGTSTFQDTSCQQPARASTDRLSARELSSLRSAITAAHLEHAKPSYLPKSESDFPGSATLTLSVAQHGRATKVMFDHPHAPESLLGVDTAIEALVASHHWLRDAAKANPAMGCYCTNLNEHDNDSDPLGVRAYETARRKACQ